MGRCDCYQIYLLTAKDEGNNIIYRYSYIEIIYISGPRRRFFLVVGITVAYHGKLTWAMRYAPSPHQYFLKKPDQNDTTNPQTLKQKYLENDNELPKLSKS